MKSCRIFRSLFLQFFLLSAIVGVSSVPAHAGSITNLWNINQGIVIITNSPMDFKVGSDVRNMFGASYGWGAESVFAIFADGQPDGFTHFVEWKTANWVKLDTILLYAAGDGSIYSNEREFASFVLKTKSKGSSTFDTVLCSLMPQHPYVFINPLDYLMLSTNVAGAVGMEFRAEFVQWNAGRGFDGPRIVELEASGDYVEAVDQWSFDHKITILQNSPVDYKVSSDIWNMFGRQGVGPEKDRTVFGDGKPPGFVHFVEWQTTNFIRLDSIALYAEGDGAIYMNEREFKRFTLKAKSNGSTNFNLLLCEVYPTHPYTLISKTPLFGLLLQTNISPVVAREFRAEFEQWEAGRGYDGPRIERLQGFGVPVYADGIPDSWRQQYFGTSDMADARIAPTADPDGDGANNYEEFLAGTNPTDANSVPATLPTMITFSPNGGEFTNYVSISINPSLPQAQVYYWLEDPGQSNAVVSPGLYVEPVVIDVAKRIVARLYVGGTLISRDYSADFVRIYAIDDGIPNEWRQSFFGSDYRTDPRVAADADPDGDGSINLAEYMAGTNPLDAKSVLKITDLRMVPVITWSSISNITYRLVRRDDINTNSWIVVAPAIQATNDSTSFTDYGATNNRAFYWVEPIKP
jgi:hypothetical protein